MHFYDLVTKENASYAIEYLMSVSTFGYSFYTTCYQNTNLSDDNDDSG